MSKEKSKRKFPPDKLKFLTLESASNFLSLQEKVLSDKISIFLGSGVSKSAGLPDWEGLLRNICDSFFHHWFFEIENNKSTPSDPPNNLSIAFTGGISDFNYKQSALINRFLTNDLLILTQQIKNCIRPIDWEYLLRKSLYFDEEFLYKSNLLISLTELVTILKDNLSIVINYNFDNAFEENLTEKDIKFNISSNSNDLIDTAKLTVLHPHGFIPFSGGRKSDQIIISEVDYQDLSNKPLSKENNIQLSSLFSTTCIFVGLSMSDPNLRKLLRIGSSYSKKMHFVFINDNPEEEIFNTMNQALFDKDLEQMRVKVIRYPLIDKDQDSFKFLPLLLEYLKKGIEDKDYIWK